MTINKVCHIPTCTVKTKLKRCGKCEKVWYCSVDHQRRDWSEHRKLCKKVVQIKAPAPQEKIKPEINISFVSPEELAKLGAKNEQEAGNLTRQGKYKDALKLYNSALTIATSLDVKIKIGNIHSDMGVCHNALGQHDMALKHFNLALSFYTHVTDQEKKSLEAVAHDGKIQTFIDMKEFSQAVTLCKQHLLASQQSHNENMQARAYHKLAICYGVQGALLDAITQGKLALGLFEKLGDKYHQAILCSYIGQCLKPSDDDSFSETLVYFKKAKDLFKEVGKQDHVQTINTLAQEVFGKGGSLPAGVSWD